MKQPSVSDIEYSLRKRTTKREEFLNIMNKMIPWEACARYIPPYYPLDSAVVRLWASKIWMLR